MSVIRRATGAAAWVLLLASPACSSCAGETTTPGTGATDAGRDTSAGGTGGHAGSGGSTSGSGGDAAIPDSSLDADAADGFGGPAPVWQDVGKVFDCTFERITNASELRLFRWIQCPGDATCAMAEFLNPALWLDGSSIQHASVVHDNGQDVYAAFGLIRTKEDWFTVFTDGDGWLVEGVRCRSPNGVCIASNPGLWGDVYSVLGTDDDSINQGKFSCLTGRFSTHQMSTFQVETMSLIGQGSLGVAPMATNRWVWRWAPKIALLSFSNMDGSDLRVFAEATGEVWNISEPTSAGDVFLFPEQLSVNGEYGTRISWSDGISPPAPYLVPGASEYYGTPRFANSHVGWLRGTGLTGTSGELDHVEVWASPFDEDPSKLQPSKVGDTLLRGTTSDAVGGFGHYAIPSMKPSAGERGVSIWNLQAKSLAERLTPSFAKSRKFLGITRTHLWMTGSDPAGSNTGDYLFRFTVDD